ncbi:MAG: membrane protein insertase YidC [Micrococcaceae bacterium]
MQAIFDFFGLILWPFKWFVAFLLVTFHKIFTVIGMNPASGITWVLSIAGLVIALRTLLIPVLFKQIKAQRQMAVVQPELMALQKKYKGKTDMQSRQAMAQEQQDLFKRHGTTPFASCMPLLIQMPFFIALYHTLIGIQQDQTIGPLNHTLVEQFKAATIFGAPFSSTFMTASGDGALAVKILAVVMIVIMSATQFLTQKQLMFKNMSEAALQGPFMQQQKMMLYLFPLMFAIGGFNFPIGILIYWMINNIWTMGQQYYVIRNNPTPGSQAEKEYHARLKAKGKPIPPKPGSKKAEAAKNPELLEPKGQRVQPKGKQRAKKKGGKSNSPTVNKQKASVTESQKPKGQRVQPKGKQGGKNKKGNKKR